MSTEKVFSPSEMQMVTFNLGNESFGVDIMNVQEIIRIPEITRVPQTPVYVEGVTNLRRQVLPVIDTRTRFGMDKGLMDEAKRVIVVDVYEKTVGLSVDSVSEVLRVECKSIEAAPDSLAGDMHSGSITGVVKINDGKKLVMILDVARLCNIESQNLKKEVGERTVSNRAVAKDTVSIEEVQIVSFLLGNEEFGLEIDKVKEIIRFPDIVKVPNAPFYIKGMISLRDTLMPIVDLRTKLDAGKDEITETTRVVVADINGTLMGLVVDRVYEVIRVSKDTIFPPPEMLTGKNGEKITGIAHLDGGKRIIMLMDLQGIVSRKVIDELGEQVINSVEELADEGYFMEEVDEEQMVVFRLDGEQFGISINQVQEITKLSKITKIPRTPMYVEGVVNLRGDVIPVLDLRKRFELDIKEYNQFTRIIVSDVDKKKVGIIVDEVLEVLQVPRRYMEKPPEILQDQKIQRLLEGIANLGERIIMTLDLENMLQASEWKKLAELSNPDPTSPHRGGRLKKQARI